jgi:hypothetical protein
MVDLLNQSDEFEGEEAKAEKKAARRQKKLEESLDARPLDPWERYRALTDLVDRYMECAEMLDRKTRFALIIVGTLNAVNALILLRPDVLPSGIDRSWLAVYVGCYLGLSLYVFVEAIDELKPRLRSLLKSAHGVESPGESRGLSLMRDVAAQSVDGFYETWRQARFDQLNPELAQQAQQMGQVNLVKFAALSRLFKGLLVLVVLTAGLIGMIAYRAAWS